ncbi:adenylyl cyclase-associated protein [Trichocladium antarcticum]|uniref:Adenylyl cyclase-associated protein n=1 Tax=Trichocladium antarcticum TaxID=1450529 RepID=A0AAN6UJI3_9PEZI|nr:adenylyl cyclase-associated protein [Trichocladium antarcticum]
MAASSMHNLTTLVKRLEAATSRLEDIAQSALELPGAVPALHQVVAPPKASTPATLPPASRAPVPAPAPSAPEPVPESIDEFDNLISQSVESWAKLSTAIDGLLAEQAAKVVQAFKEQRKFLLITTKAKKPDMAGAGMSVFQDLLKPTSDLMTAIGKIKDSNRGSPLYNNYCTVAEGIVALAWVTLDSKPFKQVDEGLASAQFWGNKILAANKNK